VRAETRRRVQASISTLGYVPNSAARSLSQLRKGTAPRVKPMTMHGPLCPEAPPTPLSEPTLALLAQRLRILGHPLRISLLTRLSDGEASVRELTEAVHGVQQNVSQHLAILHQAGILSRHKRGTHVLYQLADPNVETILNATRASVARHSHQLAQWTADLE
jgi:DNA-binding transcriptional ArsR family regulator